MRLIKVDKVIEMSIHAFLEQILSTCGAVGQHWSTLSHVDYIVTCKVHPALVKQVHSQSAFFNFKWSVIRLTLSR